MSFLPSNLPFLVFKVQHRRSHTLEDLRGIPTTFKKTRHELIDLHDSGGLIYPSLGVFKLCGAAESIFRAVTLNGSRLTLLPIASLVAMTLDSQIDPRQIFPAPEFSDHLLISLSHGLVLCRMVVKKFLTVRILHYNRSRMLVLKGVSIRQTKKNEVKMLGFWLVVLPFFPAGFSFFFKEKYLTKDFLESWDV